MEVMSVQETQEVGSYEVSKDVKKAMNKVMKEIKNFKKNKTKVMSLDELIKMLSDISTKDYKKKELIEICEKINVTGYDKKTKEDIKNMILTKISTELQNNKDIKKELKRSGKTTKAKTTKSTRSKKSKSKVDKYTIDILKKQYSRYVKEYNELLGDKKKYGIDFKFNNIPVHVYENIIKFILKLQGINVHWYGNKDMVNEDGKMDCRALVNELSFSKNCEWKNIYILDCRTFKSFKLYYINIQDPDNCDIADDLDKVVKGNWKRISETLGDHVVTIYEGDLSDIFSYYQFGSNGHLQTVVSDGEEQGNDSAVSYDTNDSNDEGNEEGNVKKKYSNLERPLTRGLKAVLDNS